MALAIRARTFIAMTATSPPLQRLVAAWPALALVSAAVALATAHASESFGGLYPCALCLRQREVYWGVIAIALVGLITLRVRPRPELHRALRLFLGLGFLTGALVASYHVAVEQGLVMARCDVGVPDGPLFLDPTDTTPIIAPRCDEPAWSFYGMTMAGFNAVISFALAAFSFFAATQSGQRP
jgi:disulfide bond formation protein DsbB